MRAAAVRAALVRYGALTARTADARLARARHAAAASAAQPAEAATRALRRAGNRRQHSALHATEAGVALAPSGDAYTVARAAARAVAGCVLACLPREPRVTCAGAVVSQTAAEPSTVAGADEGQDERAVVARVTCVTFADGRLRRHVAATVPATVAGTDVIEHVPALLTAEAGLASAGSLVAGAVRPAAVIAAVPLRSEISVHGGESQPDE